MRKQSEGVDAVVEKNLFSLFSEVRFMSIHHQQSSIGLFKMKVLPFMLDMLYEVSSPQIENVSVAPSRICGSNDGVLLEVIRKVGQSLR